MKEQTLEKTLTREMSLGDFCNQRIIRTIPLLNPLVCSYMIDTNTYIYPKAFLAVIKEWNEERLKEINSETLKESIFEIMKFNESIDNIYKEYSEMGIISFSQDIINSLTLKNYKILAKKCSILYKDFNYSKILHRAENFKKKLLKVFQGKLSLEDFIEKEIIPQKNFINSFVENMKEFSTNQIPIFVLCYDIKKI